MVRGVARGTLGYWLAARLWRATGRVARNRRDLYGGARGLRIVTFHDTVGREGDQLARVVDWYRERLDPAGPADADALVAGRWADVPRDRLLFTFDDGLESHYAAARLLQEKGIAATFFVVPSLVGRTMREYVAFHERYGVPAHVPYAGTETRGLSRSQVLEMRSMGHRIAAHNFAHRDLGELRDLEAIRYEVDNALDAVGELTGEPCEDFAISIGQPENVSEEAAAYLRARCARVYACHRGLNAPGRTPRFLLRHAFWVEHPQAFTRVCLEGGGDHQVADRAERMARRVGRLPWAGGAPAERP